MSKKYCGWCNEYIESKVERPNQVVCPKCRNFIPTSKKVMTGSLTGKSHIHYE